MRGDRSKDSGFTLIELLLSLAIFSIISVAVYSTFAGGVLAWRRAQDFSSTTQTTRLILEKIAGDLRTVVKIKGSEFIGGSKKLSFLVLRRGPAASEIRRITYEVERDALFRLDESYVEGLQEDHREPDLMTSPIAGLEFQYVSRGEEGETDWDWSDVWEESEGIPVGVKIILTMPGRQEVEIQFAKVVFMPLGLQGEKGDETQR